MSVPTEQQQQSEMLSAILSELQAIRAENTILKESTEETKRALEILQASNTSHQTTSSIGLATPVPSYTEPHRRPRTKLPDPALFEGTKSLWRSWKLEVENKLAEDGEALGNELSQFRYIYSRLTGKAKESVTTFVEVAIKQGHGNTTDLLYRLDLLYGIRDRKQKALHNLHNIVQGESESFASFYPRFEKEISNADAGDWPDDSKISYLQNALNNKIKQALVNAPPSEIDSYTKLATKCEYLSSRMELLGQWIQKRGPNNSVKRTQAPFAQDMMEWEPTAPLTTQANATNSYNTKNSTGFPSKRLEDQELLGKRAKWVGQEEMNARRYERRCLRCGRHGCRIAICPLAAPIRPSNSPSRIMVTDAAIEEVGNEQ
jgi:hypothetical protein